MEKKESEKKEDIGKEREEEKKRVKDENNRLDAVSRLKEKTRWPYRIVEKPSNVAIREDSSSQ